MPRPKKSDEAAKPRYVYKTVRALQPMWDGIELRDTGDTFVHRVVTHMPERDEKRDKNGFLLTADVVRDAQGKVKYYELDHSNVFEIIGEAPADEATYLDGILNDPVVLLPDHQRPPEDPRRRPAPNVRPTPVGAGAPSDGGVL